MKSRAEFDLVTDRKRKVWEHQMSLGFLRERFLLSSGGQYKRISTRTNSVFYHLPVEFIFTEKLSEPQWNHRNLVFVLRTLVHYYPGLGDKSKPM